MTSYTIKDIMSPVTNRFIRFCMRVHSTLLDQSAAVERAKAWQHNYTAKFFNYSGQKEKEAVELQYEAEAKAKADEFEKQAMLIRADMRYYP